MVYTRVTVGKDGFIKDIAAKAFKKPVEKITHEGIIFQ
jgi:hypothetical protein